VLDEFFGTTVPGLYVTGFSATRDFGPFFGFVKGSPAAATLIVRDHVRRIAQVTLGRRRLPPRRPPHGPVSPPLLRER
jgi:hypothetical protein